MAKYNLLLPRMGESVSEATVVKWLKQPGDSVEIDDAILDIATDKVDSEVPSPVNGKIVEQLFKENEVAQVGDILAVLEIEGEEVAHEPVEKNNPTPVSIPSNDPKPAPVISKQPEMNTSGRFYSPLVKNIAAEEGISLSELDAIKGSGLEGRLTKEDILAYIASKKDSKGSSSESVVSTPAVSATSEYSQEVSASVSASAGDEIIEMDRMRKLIAEHMVSSVKTSPHVCSFIETDVTNIVNWRNRVKSAFEK